MLEAKDIVLKPEAPEIQHGSVYGKRFASSGGVTAAVIQALKETEECSDVNVMVCNGAAECKKALTLLRAGRLPADFAEGMACEGGCVSGPGCAKFEFDSRKDRQALLSQADDRKIWENLNKNVDTDAFSMHRE